MADSTLHSATPPLLRPLGFGELFDRAITLYLRNFLPFVGIVAVLMLPLAILQFAVDTSQSGQLASILSQIQHTNRHAPPALPNFTVPIIVTLLLSFLVVLLAYPVVFGAMACGVGRLYSGMPVTFRESYSGALAHWGRLFRVVGLYLAMGIGGYIAFVIALTAIILVITFAGGASTAVAIVLGIISGLLLLAFVGIVMLFSMTWYFAIYAVVIEGSGVGEAIGRAFSRVFNRTEMWRALLLTICAGLIALAGQFIILALALTAQFFGQIWLDVLLKTISSLLVYPFSIIIIAVYYFDVRVRREGYDLEAKLGQLTAAQPT